MGFKKMTWVNPKEIDIIIKNCVTSIIDDLDYYDYEYNKEYKKKLLVFFDNIFTKYGLLADEQLLKTEDL